MLLLGLGAAAEQSSLHVTLSTTTARPGDVILLTLLGSAGTPQGNLGGRPLDWYRDTGHWEALSALPLEVKPGKIQAWVEVKSAPARRRWTGELTLQAATFPAQTLAVESRFAEPPPDVAQKMAEDRAVAQKAFSLRSASRLFRRKFSWPRPPHFTAHFGDRRLYNGKLSNQHYAADLAGRQGDSVLASNDGRVVLVRELYLTGNTVVVFHGVSLFTSYAHLSRVDVKEGDWVQRGDALGRVGKTGRATGPHLHFAVHADGLYVNPESLLLLKFP